MPVRLPPSAIFGHRGDSAHAPENTLAAFRLALQKGADGIELDVHLSADGQVVVLHDAQLNRTTNGQGIVHQRTLAELKSLSAGSWHSPEYAAEKIPTLREVLELVGNAIITNIELKGSATHALTQKVTALVRELGLEDKVIYSSFNPWMLLHTRRNSPQAALGLLTLPGWPGKLTRLLFEPLIQPWSLNPHYPHVDAAYLIRAQRYQRAVLAYTVNAPEDIQHLFSIGIQGIITDDPAKAIALRDTAQ